jgi:hypothetical protein
MSLNFKRDSSTLLISLICADILFIVLHILYLHTDFITDCNFKITTDRGFAELFQYGKEISIAMMLLWLFIKEFDLCWLSWTLVFGYIALDDSFMIHERIGSTIAVYFGYGSAISLRAKDFGELTVSVIVASIFLPLLGIAYIRSSAELKKIIRNLVIMLGGLALFGVLVDLIHQYNKVKLWGLVEDGGEMFVMSIICWYVFLLFRERGTNMQPHVIRQII